MDGDEAVLGDQRRERGGPPDPLRRVGVAVEHEHERRPGANRLGLVEERRRESGIHEASGTAIARPPQGHGLADLRTSVCD